MKLYRKINRIIIRFPALITLSICIFLLSGQINLFAGQELSSPANYQGRTVKGTVTDDAGVPIPGVNVVIKGTTSGVVTSSNGTFTITVPNDDAVLVFSFVGYTKYEIPVGDQTEVSLAMEEDTQQIEEVIVIGYGTQSREVLTTSVTKLDNKVLENIPYANIGSALQGNVSGVRVQSYDGQPGSQPRIIVRGGTSINSPDGASPLYIVDGVIRSNMMDINSADIESLQVLKDAAATAIYGARGSNGVVIITTKTGKAGRVAINYDYNLSIAKTLRRYNLAHARDFIYFQRLGLVASGVKDPSQLNQLTQPLSAGTGNDLSKNTAYTTQYLIPGYNDHKLNEGWESMPDPLDPNKTIIYKHTDFQDKLFRTAMSHNHYLSASGGTDKATFIVGLGYLSNEGIAITTDYTRYSANLGGNFKLRDNLTIGGKMSYSYADFSDIPNYLDVFKSNIATSQTTKYTYEDGTLAPGRATYQGNPEYYVKSYDTKDNRQHLTITVDANWEILPGLTFTPQLSFYQNIDDSRSFRKAYWEGPTSYNVTRNSAAYYNKRLQAQLDAVLSYTKSIGKHSFDVHAGYAYFNREQTTISAQGNSAATDLVPTLSAAGAPTSVNGTEIHQVLIGYFGRINYNYNKKYLFTFNARTDGASNLGDNNKWGFFPGVSLGWNVHRENFWTPFVPVISQLKLRGSYGENGNIGQIGEYAAQGTYAVGSRYDNAATIQNTALANQSLKWEQTKTFNLGFDIGLFDNRISMIFDWFNKRTDNLLTTLTLPHSTGFSGITSNLGSLENKGIELELSAQVMHESKKFQWDVSFNISKVKNKIIKLPYNGIENNRVGGFYVWDPSRNDYAWLGGTQEGGTMGDMYAYKQISIYATDEEAAQGPKDNIVPGSNKAKHGGDVNWYDADNNNIIDEKDRVYMGNQYPTWTGGLSNYFTYGGLSLSFRLDYTLGHTIYNEPRARYLGQFSGQAGLSSEITRSWQKQGDKTDIPRFYWADQNQKSNLYRGNSRYYESGDFLMIREVTLSYNLPQVLLQKIKVDNMRFYVTGNNLYYFTNYTSLNPEEGGTDNGRFPIPRTIIFGFQLTF